MEKLINEEAVNDTGLTTAEEKEENTSVKLSIKQFIKEYFLNYKSFIKNHLSTKKPPYIFFVIWLYGIAKFWDRIEIGKASEITSITQNWTSLWIVSIIFGLFIGWISFFVFGWAFHLIVKLSGGSNDLNISRNIFIYSSLPPCLLLIASEIVDTIIYGSNYFTEPINSIEAAILMCLSISVAIYSIILAYIAVRTLQATKLFRSIIFFLVIPIIYNIAVYSAIFSGTSPNAAEGLEYYKLAYQQIAEGHYEEAENNIQLALEQLGKGDKEERREIYSNIASAYRNIGNSDKEIEYIKKWIDSCEPDSAEYYSALGDMNLAKRNMSEAKKNYQKSIQLDDGNFNSYNSLGLIYLGEYDYVSADYKKAVLFNKKAFDLDSNDITRMNLALSYYRNKQYYHARDQFKILEENKYEEAKVKYYLGVIYYNINNIKMAQKYLNEAVEINSSYNNDFVQQIMEKN